MRLTIVNLFRAGVKTVHWSGITGALLIALMGGLAFGVGGAVIPLVVSFGGTFFSSLPSLVRRGELQTDLQEKHPRTWKNAVANGSAATVIAIWSLSHFYALSQNIAAGLFVGSLAAAISDTASHELGVLFGGKPRMITTLKLAQKGEDGAISFIGTLTGLLTSFALCGIALWLGLFHERLAITAAIGGFAGNIVDSILGATLQHRKLIGGNSVNFYCTLVGAGITFLLIKVFNLL